MILETEYIYDGEPALVNDLVNFIAQGDISLQITVDNMPFTDAELNDACKLNGTITWDAVNRVFSYVPKI